MKSPRSDLSSLMPLIGLLLCTSFTMTAAQSLSRCYVSMVIADQQGTENDLLNRDEYVTFASRISTSFDASGTPFNGLPAPLQQNFVTYAGGTDQINIFGAKPTHDETAEQEAFLVDFCDGTMTAINALANPTMAPSVGSSSPPSTPRPTRPLNQCFVGMIASDANRNALLDASDYVGFLNFLEPGPFADMTYSQLPLTLQSNYANLVENNDAGIDVSGLPNPNDDQFRKLNTICDITNTAISIALNIPTDPPLPTTEPTSLPTVSAPNTRSPITLAPIPIAPVTSAPFGGDTEEPTVFPTESPTIFTPSISRAPITFAPVVSVTVAPNTRAPVTVAPVTTAPGSSRPSKEPTTLPTLNPTTVPTTSPSTAAMNNDTLAPVTMAPTTRAPVTRSPVMRSPNTTPQATSPPTFAPTPSPPTSGSIASSRSMGAAAAATMVISMMFLSFEFIC